MTQTVRTFQPAKPFIHGFFGLLLLVLFSTSGLAGIPAGYYDPAAGKTGATLKTALYNIIKGHTSKSYDYLWTAFQTTDKKANGKVWDMYSDIPGGTPPYEFTFGTNQCGNYGGEGDCFNREHSWPKSWFGGTVAPMYTDLFHLCPTDGYVNGNRSNYPFGTVSSPSWTSLNGSKVGPCSWTGYTGTVFEPRDDFKGDFARNYLYMATRYENLIAGWPGNDANAAAILAGNTYPAFKTWYVGMLLSWSAADPVSAKEIARNDAVYSIQNNRNPYIDHPEYAIAVWAPETIKGEPTNFPTSFTVTTGSPSWSSLSLTWTDATGIVIPDGYLIRGSATSFAAIAAPVDGTPVDDGGLDKNIPAGTQAYTFRGLATNTTYYFKIFPYTNTGGLINFKTTGTIPQASFTTTPVMGSGLIFISQYYEDAGSNKWIEVTNPGSDIDLAADPVYLMIISGSTAQNVTNTNPALCASLNTGVFEGGTSRLIKNPSSTLPSYAVADFSSLNMNFDGTYDVVFLSMSGNTLAPLSWNARTDAAGEVINNLTTSTSIADRSLYRRNIFTSGAMTFSSGDWVQNTNAEVDIAAAGTPERLGFHGFNYFSKATGNLDLLATWGTAADGSGTMPAGFNFINQIFTVQNRSSATVAGDWTIAAPGSKLIIGNGVNSSTVSGSVYNISVPSLEIRANGTLDVSSGKMVTVTGTTTFMGLECLQLRNGALLSNAGTLALKRDLVNENVSPLALGNGTVEFSGAVAQTVSGQNIFRNLTINNAAGLTIGGTTRINGTLTWAGGRITCGSNHLVFGTDAAFAGTPSPANMIVATGTGELRKEFPAGFSGSFTFPVGDAAGTPEYSPVTVGFTAGTFETGNYTGVNLVNSKYPGTTADFLNRYWNLSQTGISNFSCNLVFQYIPGDVTGDESLIYTTRVDPLPMVWYDQANTTAHQLSASGVTSFGTFTGQDRSPLPAVFEVTGTGYYCQGGTGLPVTLSGSETGVNYQLKKNGVNEGIAAPGTGSPLEWPNNPDGTYTVEAINTDITLPMNGNAVITEIFPEPVSISIVSDMAAVCVGGQVTFTATPVNGGANPSFHWFVNDLQDLLASALTYTYLPSNGDLVKCLLTSDLGCVTGNPAISNEVAITVNPFPDPAGTVAGPDTVIRGQIDVAFSVPVIGNALYYQWELPAGAVITAGDSTNNVLVTFSGASQSGVVRVKGTNPCGDGIPSPDFSVTVTDAIPAQLTVADTIIPGQTICFNATQTITVAGAGTTFLVENGGDAALIAGENIVFLEGTTIQEGGHLWAWITTTADYCAANFPAMVTAVAKETETAPETPSQPSISVYPNPTDDKFILSCNSPGTGFPVRITIYNMTGKRVAEEILTGTIQKEFSLVRQPSGIYILHAASGHGSEMVKIIRK